MLSLEIKGKTLNFEHSLSSLSKWESYYERPFFRKTIDEDMTGEELMKYFEFMVVSPVKHAKLVNEMEPEDALALQLYIDSAMTGTTISEIVSDGKKKENVSAELIYYWMISFKIPFTCDQWHLNRLMTLIRVCGNKAEEQKPKKKMTTQQRQAHMAKVRAENERRRKELGTSG